LIKDYDTQINSKIPNSVKIFFIYIDYIDTLGYNLLVYYFIIKIIYY